MNNKTLGIGLVVVAIIAISGLLFPQVTREVRELVEVGAAVGPEHLEHQSFRSDITVGGTVRATTTEDGVSAETLTAALLDNHKVFRYTTNQFADAMTITLPASSTMPNIIPYAGDTRTWIFENGYTAAATTTTLAAGTGIDLQEPDGQNVVIGINNYAFLTCFRESSSDIVCKVDETIPAD